MRVVVERVRRGPPHSLTLQDIKAIVRTAEAALGRFPGLVVHLKMTMPENTAFDRPVVYAEGCNRLNVLCRGLTREEAVREVLRELVVVGTRVSTRRGLRLSADELKMIDDRVALLLPRVMAAIG